MGYIKKKKKKERKKKRMGSLGKTSKIYEVFRWQCPKIRGQKCGIWHVSAPLTRYIFKDSFLSMLSSLVDMFYVCLPCCSYLHWQNCFDLYNHKPDQCCFNHWGKPIDIHLTRVAIDQYIDSTPICSCRTIVPGSANLVNVGGETGKMPVM